MNIRVSCLLFENYRFSLSYKYEKILPNNPIPNRETWGNFTLRRHPRQRGGFDCRFRGFCVR